MTTSTTARATASGTTSHVAAGASCCCSTGRRYGYIWTDSQGPVGRSVTITLAGRPKTLNHISSAGHWEKSEEIRTWRHLARLMSKKLPALTPPVDIEVTQLCKPRKMPDHIGPTWAIKGSVDGLVDAGLIPDDDGRYVCRLILNAPQKAQDDALVLVVREVGE